MKKRVLLLIISIIVVIFILTTTTYAFFYNTDRLANSEDYTTGLLDIEVDTTSSGLGNVITLNNAMPMTDINGMNTTPYRFKLTNVGNLDYQFDLNFTKSGTINGNYVRLAVDDNTPINLANTTTTILDDFLLYAGESKTISIRIWLAENTPNSEMTKTFSGTLSGTGAGQVFPFANDKIISLSQGATCSAGASGLYATNAYEANGQTKYHEYRYIGAEPNNYVRFNDDMYQIIGVFDKNSYDIAGVTNNDYGDYLVKLIAVNPLTAVAWGAYNTTASSGTYSNFNNDWTGSVTGVPASANIILNQYFLNPNNLTAGYTNSTYGACSNWTYMLSNASYNNKNCSTIIGYGISSSQSSYIETVTWYLKGFNSTSYTRGDFYNCERGLTTGDATKDSNCNTGSTGTTSATTSAKIGLMYASDYTYASGNFACNNTELASEQYMGNRNWLYKGHEWTITPKSDGLDFVFFVNFNGRVMCNTYTRSGYNIRPTIYLKATTKIKSGDGTFNNPYTIG